MRKIFLVMAAAIMLDVLAGGMNLGGFQNNLSANWTHSGAGGVKNINLKEDGEDLRGVEMTGGETSLVVECYRFEPYMYSPAGRFCRLSLKARGKGAIEVAIKALVSDEAGKITTIVSASKTVELSDKWTKIELDAQDKNPRVTKHMLSVSMTSGDKVMLANSEFEYFGAPGAELKMTPRTALGSPGEKGKVRMSLTKDGNPVPGAAISAAVFSRLGTHQPDSPNAFAGKIQTLDLKTDENGAAECSFDTDTSGYGSRVCAFAPEQGVSAEAFVAFAAPDLARRIKDDAAALKLSKPVSILIIGDSLSDFSRGFNYADIILSELDKTSPGMVRIKNAAVGGDFITRVWERLSGELEKTKPAAGNYRKYMYDGLLDGKPDIVFIMLGHNDTRSWSDCEFKEPDITPEVQETAYMKLINHIRERSPKTKVVLLSNVSTYLPIQEENAAKAKAKGTKHCIYGFPQYMDGFNDVLKKIAEKEKLDFVDLYTPTKANSDRKSLFLPDGVHLSPRGNQVAAELLLRILAERRILEGRP